MGMIAGFVFMIGLAVSGLLVFIASIIEQKTGKGLGGEKRWINLFIAAMLSVLIIYIGFFIYPAIDSSGAPTAEAYERLLIQAGIIGLSPGLGRLFAVIIQRVVQSVLGYKKS